MTEEIILLVEDNPTDELLTLRALKKANIVNRIVVVRDGQEAIDYLFTSGAHAQRNPDERAQVVLLDLNLPKVGGIEVLARIRADEKLRRTPVVILTSSHEERDLMAGYDSGANSYVVKPVDFTQFAESVRQLGLYWLVVNRAGPR